MEGERLKAARAAFPIYRAPSPLLGSASSTLWASDEDGPPGEELASASSARLSE